MDKQSQFCERFNTINAKNKGWTHDSSFKDSLKYNFDDSEYSGYYTHRLAADDKYIYALAYTPVYNETYSRNEPKDIHLYCSSKVKGEWEEVTAVSKAIENYISHLKNTNFMMDASIQLFCTNSPKKEHRKAFIRIGGGSPYYSSQSSNYEQNYGVQEAGNYGIIPLNGTATDVNTPVPFGTNGATHKTLSAVYFDDGDGDDTNNVHFFNTSASDTNETRNDEATYVYYGSGKTLKSFAVSDYVDNLSNTVTVLHSVYNTTEGKTSTNDVSGVNRIDAAVNSLSMHDSDGETEKIVSAPDDVIKETKRAGGDIISLCVTKTSVLIGTDEYGVYRAMLTDGKPADSTKDFDNNAATIMTKPYIVRVLLCTDPSIGEEEEGSALYGAMDFHYTQSTASADYDNVGLWSYYHSRGNWNRE